jgi:chromosome segregation ATPase
VFIVLAVDLAEEKYRTPRKGGSIGVGTRKELETRLLAKEELLLEAQQAVGAFTKQLAAGGLTPEREEKIEGRLQAAETREAELKKEVQKLEAQIKSLSAPRGGEPSLIFRRSHTVVELWSPSRHCLS